MIKLIEIEKQLIEDHSSRFVEIIRQVDFQYWEKEHFLMDLPGKWDYSFAAIKEENNLIVGFIICSLKNESTLHEHKLFVSRNHRNQGIGKSLLSKSITKAAKNNLIKFTLNVYDESKIAISFYKKLGMEEKDRLVDNIGLRYFLEGDVYQISHRLKDNIIEP